MNDIQEMFSFCYLIATIINAITTTITFVIGITYLTWLCKKFNL